MSIWGWVAILISLLHLHWRISYLLSLQRTIIDNQFAVAEATSMLSRGMVVNVEND